MADNRLRRGRFRWVCGAAGCGAWSLDGARQMFLFCTGRAGALAVFPQPARRHHGHDGGAGGMHLLDGSTRADLVFSVRFIMNRIPRGHLKAFVAEKWPASDLLAEQIVAEAIVDGLVAQNWKVERGPPGPGAGSVPPGPR